MRSNTTVDHDGHHADRWLPLRGRYSRPHRARLRRRLHARRQSRGCHTITLRPDGTYRNFLFDAAVNGTYVITGSVVKMTATEPEMTEELPLSADGATLGTLPLKSGAPAE